MITIDPLAVAVVALSFAALFAAAACHKFNSRPTLAAIIADYQMLSAPAAATAARILPFIELVVAFAAVFAWIWDKRLILPAVLLLLLYAVAIGINLLRGRTHIDCGCLGFGQRGETIHWWMVARNIVMATFGAAVVVLPSSGRPLNAADIIALVGTGLTLPLLYIGLHHALQSFSPPETT